MLVDNSLWGHFLADMVIRSIGTDYARIVKAIFAIAQVFFSSVCISSDLFGHQSLKLFRYA